MVCDIRNAVFNAHLIFLFRTFFDTFKPMKLLAVLLSAYILFLCAAGAMKPVEQPGKRACCHKMAGMTALQLKKMKQQHKKDCEQQTCPLMFSCPFCGFVLAEPLKLESTIPTYLSKPISLYTIGDLSAYHPSDWKPPKSC